MCPTYKIVSLCPTRFSAIPLVIGFCVTFPPPVNDKIILSSYKTHHISHHAMCHSKTHHNIYVGDKFFNLGRGLCRGDNWQDDHGVWPKDEGKETFEECLKACTDDVGCTAFDVAPIINSLKFKCTLYGHDDIRRTNSVSLKGRCIRMVDRKALPTTTGQKEAVTKQEGNATLIVFNEPNIPHSSFLMKQISRHIYHF